MAFSKITLNGVTLMDVTQKTVTAASMLKDVTALKNDGTDVAGSIASKTVSDLSVSGATVTAPSGFYGSDVSASVDSMTLPTSASTSSNGGTRKATIGRSTSTQYINIPAGYNDAKAYYQISAVANGSAATPATTITANPTISVGEDGLITATTSASKSITPTVSAGYVSSGTAGTVSVNGSNTSQLTVQPETTITPTETEQTAVEAGKFTTGAVKVGAISSTYVGSGINQNDSDDLTVSGATVTAPAGYYSTSASKTVASGTVGTPTASKGTVSNHSVSITPSVTNTTGYITGGTKSGTPVSVSASELVSGTLTISSSGTKDVTNYASASVAAGSAKTPATTVTANPSVSVNENGLITATASATKSITPTVTAGYVSSGTSGTVTVSGSNTSQLATQAAQTIHPSTSDQTITSGQYLTGTQTIKKVVVSDSLNASNIKAGVTITIGDEDDADRIISVTGTYSVAPKTVTMMNGVTTASTSATFENDVYILSTLQVTGTFTSLKLYVEGRCNTAGDWIKLAFIDQTDYILTDGATGITAKGIYEASVAGINQYRVRSESIAGGNVSVVSVFTR